MTRGFARMLARWTLHDKAFAQNRMTAITGFTLCTLDRNLSDVCKSLGDSSWRS